MNVGGHSITFVSSDCGRYYHKSVSANNVANASLLLEAFVASVGDKVELEGLCYADEEQETAKQLHK